MVKDDSACRLFDATLPRHLALLQRTTGLPVVFGGPTVRSSTGRQLVISHLAGTLGDSLRRLTVTSGRGLGGTVVERGVPCRVDDYASTAGITHDYDRMVVEQEKLTSVFAFPVMVRDEVHGVLYGAVRDSRPIGDTALRNAGVVASRIAKDLTTALRQPIEPSGPTTPTVEAGTALDDLAALARSVADPGLRDQLAQIHRRLGGVPPSGVDSPTVTLAPREIEALQLVAVGASNAEIAHELGLSLDTVKSYLRSAMRRLDVGNRGKAVLAAREAGII